MIKSKICTICDKEYTPFTSMAKVCSVPCAIEATNLNKEKKLQKDIKAFKRSANKDRKEFNRKDLKWQHAQTKTEFNRKRV